MQLQWNQLPLLAIVICMIALSWRSLDWVRDYKAAQISRPDFTKIPFTGVVALTKIWTGILCAAALATFTKFLGIL